MPVVTDEVAEEPVAVLLTVTVPVLVKELEPPIVETAPTEDVIVPLLTMVAGVEPVEVIATLDPPAMVPLLVKAPPEIVCGPTVVPAGIVTELVGDIVGENCGDGVGENDGENRGAGMDIPGEIPGDDMPNPPRVAA